MSENMTTLDKALLIQKKERITEMLLRAEKLFAEGCIKKEAVDYFWKKLDEVYKEEER